MTISITPQSAIKSSLKLVLISAFVVACSPKQPDVQQIAGYAEGTTYSVKYWSKDSELNSEDLKNQLTGDIQKELAKIDILLSNYRPDSVIEKFNSEKRTGKFNVDPELTDLLVIAKEIHQKTNGCYDPTIGPLFAAWGFMNKENVKFTPPDSALIKKIANKIGLDKVEVEKGVITKLDPDITLSLSSMGEGYSATKISKILEKYKVTNYLIYFGGDTLMQGHKPDNSDWTIAVENPLSPGSNQYSNIINNNNDKIAVMTSGTYLHYFDDKGKRYSHIINPKTGDPVTHDTVAASVLYNNGIYADAWATSFVCLGAQEGLKVANKYNIPVIFYEDINNNIKRTFSDATKNNEWVIK